MTRRFNPWYYLGVLTLVGLYLLAWFNHGSVWAWMITFIGPLAVVVWAAYVFVVADDLIKPNVDFHPVLYYLFQLIVALAFYLLWLPVRAVESDFVYALPYFLLTVAFDYWDIFKTKALKRKLQEQARDNS